MQKTEIHLHFSGQCRAAFEYYHQLFESEAPTLLSYAESPAIDSVPDAFRNNIVHGSIEIGNLIIAGADIPTDPQTLSGFNLLLQVDSREEGERFFEGLAKNGEIEMPLQKTFWSACYGIVRDQFGVPWEINLSD